MTSESGERRLPIVLPPGEGRWVSSGPGGRTTFKVTGADTGGRFGLFESVQGPRSRGPELHYHRRMVEMFWVLEGRLHVEIDGVGYDTDPGAFALVPAGSLHRFNNPLETPSRILIMFSPGDNREEYFEGLAEFAHREGGASRDEVVDLMHRFDQYLPGE